MVIVRSLEHHNIGKIINLDAHNINCTYVDDIIVCPREELIIMESVHIFTPDPL